MTRLHLALVLAAPLVACGTTPEPFATSTESLATAHGMLPAVVAVMPVVDRVERLPEASPRSSAGVVPTEAVRIAVCEGLPGRRYAPLSLAFLDRGAAGGSGSLEAGEGWIEAAAVAREGDADALLEITVTLWDETWLDAVASVRAEAEVYLYPIEQGDPLLALRLARELRLPLASAPAKPAARREALGRVLAEEILALLPERDPLAGLRSDG